MYCSILGLKSVTLSFSAFLFKSYAFRLNKLYIYFRILFLFIVFNGEVVQWLERWNHNPNARGSNPFFITDFFHALLAQLDRATVF